MIIYPQRDIDYNRKSSLKIPIDPIDIANYLSNNLPTPSVLHPENDMIYLRNILSIEKEVPLRGIIKYVDSDLVDIKKGDLVGFTPSSEYEFIVDGERLYRVLTNAISIKYECKGNEKEYNPSWAESC